MPTIHDVAKKAGVSIKTVSRVVNNERNVRPQTREVVQAAIDALDYAPSHYARAMKAGRSGTIAFLTDSVVTTPESIDIARGVAEAASELGLTLFFLASDPDTSPFEGPNFQFIRSAQVDGIIFATHFHSEVKVPEAVLDFPLVLVNCFDNSGRVSSIVPDDRQGGLRAAELMIEHGHTRAGFVNLPKSSIASSLREQGFCNVFERRGLPIPQVTYTQPEHEIGFQADLTAKIDAMMGDEQSRPTALFCGNDKTALKVIGILGKMNLRVPEDVSIVGFDDFKLIAELVTPSLSTIAIPYLEMGRESVPLLRKIIDAQAKNQIVQPAKMQIPCWSIARDSLSENP